MPVIKAKIMTKTKTTATAAPTATAIKVKDEVGALVTLVEPTSAPVAQSQRKAWQNSDLPTGVANPFLKAILPRAKKIAGTLAPFTRLSIEDVQSLMTAVLPEYSYTVVANDVFMGLVSTLSCTTLMLTLSWRRYPNVFVTLGSLALRQQR